MNDTSAIFKVWNYQGKGYVSLPRKLRSANSPKGAKNHDGKWEEKCFQWPEDLETIKSYIIESHKEQYDIYWCPSILSQKKRVKESIPKMSVLYADLDEVDPNSLSIKPSLAWESSPNRYAAVWLLDKALPAQEAENLNKSLTYFIGADKGGWDLTQVLRIPGTKNHKYEGSPPGKLLWYNETPTNIQDIPLLPEDKPRPDFEEIDIDSNPNRLLNVINSVKDKIKSKTLSLLITSEEEIMLYDRSERLWELECQLLEQGISPEKVLELVACSHWNKYRGRKDETRRLQTEIDKALIHTGNKETKETKYQQTAKKWTSYTELLSMQISQPGWMIKDVWQKTSHGMIAGEPKTYKSVIATDMAVSVASGKPFLGKYPVEHQGPVMYIQEENDPWLVKDRISKISTTRGSLNGKAEMRGSLLTVKMPPELPIHFLNNQGFDFTNEEDRNFLEESIAEIKPVLIIFDPLYLMLNEKDESSSKDIRPVLNWLLLLRYRYKTSIIIVHHWNKSGKSERGGQRMLGSVLFHGWVESAIYTRVVNEQKHEIEVEREFRSFEKPENLSLTFNFGEPGELSYNVKLDNCGVKVSQDQVYQLLFEANKITVEDVVNALNITQKVARQRLDKLVKENKATLSNNIYTYKEDEEI